MKRLHVLGIMSGTSIDSVDYVLCGIQRDDVKLLEYWQARFPKALQQRLHAAAAGHCSSHETAQLHHDLGRFYAANVKRGLKIDLIGVHGQTIFHNPRRNAPATFQLGEPAWLAEKLRVPVVSNFRAADLAAGGQGAPLATLFHVAVFAQRGRHVCVNNLGGISNVTSMDWTKRGKRPRVIAFDTGPANILIDLAMRHYTKGRRKMDRGGAWARQGKISETLLAKWLKHPFFRKRPPKSTGRELFGEDFLMQYLNRVPPRDCIATLTELTARSIALNYRIHLPSIPSGVILAGGGAANPFLRDRITANLQLLNGQIAITTSAELGWPLQAIEPAAFAFLAYKRFLNQPGNVPETTGASQSVLLGQLSQS